jgi:biotin-dependent carboxylase-like uncharacterized protein
MSALVIREPGPATTVQDLGRPGGRRLGIPISGTLVPDWLRLANALVGNRADAAGLEVRLTGPRIEVDADSAVVVLGGPAEMRVTGADGARSVPPWTAVRARRGDAIAVGRIAAGTTAVLAVAGGIATPPFLGSRSTYARARLGGLDGQALQAGDRLPIGETPAAEPRVLAGPPPEAAGPIRVVLGPQDDHFHMASIETFLGRTYTVTDRADRMGMRLDGPALPHRATDLAQIVSDAVVPGAIQVPGSEQPIVLLADAQTVGGYPKIATVIGADLPRLARAAPGTAIRFAAVEPAAAEAALRERTEVLARLADEAHPADAFAALDARRLYGVNLVDGVVDTARPDHFPGHLERNPQ